MHEALILLCLVVALLVGIVPFVYVSIRQLGQARLLQPVSTEAYPGPHRLARLHNPWAKHFRFEWIGGYRFRGLDGRFIAAWRHAEQPVFLLVQLIKGATHYELLSIFNREQTLTTTSLNAVVPPMPPGSFVQRYPDATLTELFRSHTAAHDFLVGGGHVELKPHAVRLDRALVELLARAHAFVTNLSAWPLRGVAWVLLGPRRARNRSVPEQLGFANVAKVAGVEESSPAAAPATAPKRERVAKAHDEEGDVALDADTAAEVESLLAKASTPRQGLPDARSRSAAITRKTAPAQPKAARPAPRDGRTR